MCPKRARIKALVAGDGACEKPPAPMHRRLLRTLANGGGALRRPAAYLILASLNSTCLRTTGSYLLKLSFSVFVRGFFLVT